VVALQFENIQAILSSDVIPKARVFTSGPRDLLSTPPPYQTAVATNLFAYFRKQPRSW